MALVRRIPEQLDPASRMRGEALGRAIDKTKRDTKAATPVSRQEIENVAERYARSPSAFLAGVVGGGIGSSVGVAVSFLGGTTLVLCGPVGLAIGAALGVLLFRGRSWRRLERATHKIVGAANLIMSQIKALPEDAPPQARRVLYQQYSELMEEYARVAHRSIDDDDASIRKR